MHDPDDPTDLFVVGLGGLVAWLRWSSVTFGGACILVDNVSRPPCPYGNV